MKRRQFLAAVAAAALSRRMLAQAPGDAPAQSLDTPRKAAKDAMLWAGRLSDSDRLVSRFLWIPNGDETLRTATLYCLNAAVSQASTIVRPDISPDGRLIRLDLAELAPTDEGFVRLLRLWESLAFREPYFHSQVLGAELVFVPLPRFKHTDGRFYEGKRFTLVEAAVHCRLECLALEQLLATGIKGLPGTGAPIFRADWFLRYALATLEDGIYYDLIGVSKDTSLDEYLKRFGSSQKDLEDAARTARIGIILSNVTGKTRCVVLMYGRQVRPTDGVPIIAATLDITDEDVNPEFSTIQNLLTFTFRAIEMFVYRPNGFIECTLWNAAGQLQDSVPDNIAADHEIPRPYTKRLQPISSCIRCHGPSDFFLPTPNEAQALLRESFIVDDLTALDKSIEEIQLDLQGMYGGESEAAYLLARNGHDTAVRRVTRTGAAEACSAVTESLNAYRYRRLTARDVCRDLGYEVTEEDAKALFNQLCPPQASDFSLEHSTIRQIQIGLGATRTQYEPVFAEIATRAVANER